MSKIQAVNYQQQTKLAPIQANRASAQSFGKGLSDLPQNAQDILVKGVGERIDKRLGWMGRKYKWLADTQGEIQTQAINNIFTATLAPAMIAFNPFTKQDEKTKKYTAWRQPISAVIAMTAGLSMTLGINKFMENLYHQGYFGKIDLRMVPDKTYLKKVYYKTEEKLGFFARSWKLLKGEANCKRDDFVKKVQNERLDFFTRLLSEDPKNITFDEASKAILINGKDIQEGHKIKVPGFETKEALDKFIQANNLHKLTFGQFLKERFGFEFYANGKLKPHTTDSKLSEIKAMDFLKEMGLIDDKVNETELRKFLGVFQQARKVEDYVEDFGKCNVKMSKDIGSKLLEIHGKLDTRNIQTYTGEQFGKAKVTTLGQFLHQLSVYTTKEKLNDVDLEKVTHASLKDVLERFKKGFEEYGLYEFKDEKKLDDVAKNILKNSTKRMTEHAKNYQKFAGMTLNIITTAISCYILNWAYPRIMERVFPELSKSDKKPELVKGGSK